jgi:hypothetical protein
MLEGAPMNTAEKAEALIDYIMARQKFVIVDKTELSTPMEDVPPDAVSSLAQSFINRTRIPVDSAEEAEEIVHQAAGILGIEPARLERSMWAYMSTLDDQPQG